MTFQDQTGFGLSGINSSGVPAVGTGKHDAREIRQQYSALCYRLVRGKPQILLITSRGTGRWILPKGWPMKKRSPAEAALQEAYEEAGVIGRVSKAPLGAYRYLKLLNDGTTAPCVSLIYPVRVTRLEQDFPEVRQRNRKWCSRKKAAKRVDEPELAQLLRNFRPGALKM